MQQTGNMQVSEEYLIFREIGIKWNCNIKVAVFVFRKRQCVKDEHVYAIDPLEIASDQLNFIDFYVASYVFDPRFLHENIDLGAHLCVNVLARDGKEFCILFQILINANISS